MKDAIEKVKFAEVDLNDPFFDSLKRDYPGFVDWFYRKRNSEAYILKNDGLLAFLYLKEENEDDNTISPYFPRKIRLKISTFKVISHGTILGDRMINIILQKFISEEFEEVYVTVFPKQVALISLFEKYGFVKWGEKSNGEWVYVKTKNEVRNNILLDFPLINPIGVKKYLLSIKPEYHTALFYMSALRNEKTAIEDLDYTNTICKTYLSKMAELGDLKPGDLIVIYRTRSGGIPAEYSAVATSVCTVLNVAHISDFDTKSEFINHCGKGTVFTREKLEEFWETGRFPFIVKMLYNTPLKKRIIRKKLADEVGLSRSNYWGVLELSDEQFEKILELGEVNEGFIIN